MTIPIYGLRDIEIMDVAPGVLLPLHVDLPRHKQNWVQMLSTIFVYTGESLGGGGLNNYAIYIVRPGDVATHTLSTYFFTNLAQVDNPWFLNGIPLPTKLGLYLPPTSVNGARVYARKIIQPVVEIQESGRHTYS